MVFACGTWLQSLGKALVDQKLRSCLNTANSGVKNTPCDSSISLALSADLCTVRPLANDGNVLRRCCPFLIEL